MEIPVVYEQQKIDHINDLFCLRPGDNSWPDETGTEKVSKRNRYRYRRIDGCRSFDTDERGARSVGTVQVAVISSAMYEQAPSLLFLRPGVNLNLSRLAARRFTALGCLTMPLI